MTRIAIAFVILAGFAAPARAADLESALLDRAKGLIKHCQANKYQTVGVLKFLAAKEGSPFTDNLGTINALVARRLEVALVLVNDPRNPIGIIDDASAVAARTPGASHGNPKGREILLAARYKLAWGDPRVRVTPDAFLTGVVSVGKDLKTLRVSFLYFDRTTKKLESVPGVPDAVVTNRAAALAEMGESFAVRGYQLGTDRVETFRVLSVPESKAREVNYGTDVGTITLTVFPEGKVQVVKFTAAATPVMTLTVIYYKAK